MYLVTSKIQPLLLWVGGCYSMILQYECSGEERLPVACCSTVGATAMMFILGGSETGVVVGRLSDFAIAPYLGEMS